MDWAPVLQHGYLAAKTEKEAIALKVSGFENKAVKAVKLYHFQHYVANVLIIFVKNFILSRR